MKLYRDVFAIEITCCVRKCPKLFVGQFVHTFHFRSNSIRYMIYNFQFNLPIISCIGPLSTLHSILLKYIFILYSAYISSLCHFFLQKWTFLQVFIYCCCRTMICASKYLTCPWQILIICLSYCKISSHFIIILLSTTNL